MSTLGEGQDMASTLRGTVLLEIPSASFFWLVVLTMASGRRRRR